MPAPGFPSFLPALLIADGSNGGQRQRLVFIRLPRAEVGRDTVPFEDGARRSAYAYLVWRIHQSGPQIIPGIGTVVVVGIAIGIDVPGVGRVVQVRRAQPPIHGVSGLYPNTSRLPPCCIHFCFSGCFRRHNVPHKGNYDGHFLAVFFGKDLLCPFAVLLYLGQTHTLHVKDLVCPGFNPLYVCVL